MASSGAAVVPFPVQAQLPGEETEVKMDDRGLRQISLLWIFCVTVLHGSLLES